MSSDHSIPEKVSVLVQDSVVSFITSLVAAYDGLTSEDLVLIWNSDPKTSELFSISTEAVSTTSKPRSPPRAKKSPSPASTKKSPSPKPTPSNTTESSTTAQPTTCGYILTKGARADQPCGLKSRKGGIFCSRHKAHENTCKPCAKSIPVASRASPSKSKQSSDEFTNDTLTFRKHDTLPDCYYHIPTSFVRESGGGLYVDRKILDGELVPLTEADFETCRENKLAISPKLRQPTSPSKALSTKDRSSKGSVESDMKPRKTSVKTVKTDASPIDSIQTLGRVETDVRSAILNMNSDAIAIEAVLRELQVSPRTEK